MNSIRSNMNRARLERELAHVEDLITVMSNNNTGAKTVIKKVISELRAKIALARAREPGWPVNNALKSRFLSSVNSSANHPINQMTINKMLYRLAT